jgi:multidrug efflux pump
LPITLLKHTKAFPEAKAFVIQEQTISSGGMRGGLPVQFVLQAPNFQQLKEKLPLFLEEANKSKIFQTD